MDDVQAKVAELKALIAEHMRPAPRDVSPKRGPGRPPGPGVPRGSVITAIRDLFGQNPARVMTWLDVVRVLGVNERTAQNTLNTLACNKELMRVGPGRYVKEPIVLAEPEPAPMSVVRAAPATSERPPEQCAEPATLQPAQRSVDADRKWAIEELRAEVLFVLREDGGAWSIAELVDALSLSDGMAVRVGEAVDGLRALRLVVDGEEGRVRLRPPRRRFPDGLASRWPTLAVLAIGQTKHAACDGDGCSLCGHTGYA